MNLIAIHRWWRANDRWTWRTMMTARACPRRFLALTLVATWLMEGSTYNVSSLLSSQSWHLTAGQYWFRHCHQFAVIALCKYQYLMSETFALCAGINSLLDLDHALLFSIYLSLSLKISFDMIYQEKRTWSRWVCFETAGMYMRASDRQGWAASRAHDTLFCAHMKSAALAPKDPQWSYSSQIPQTGSWGPPGQGGISTQCVPCCLNIIFGRTIST